MDNHDVLISPQFSEMVAYIKTGYKQLEGSEKQILWANQVRDKFAEEMAFFLIKKSASDSKAKSELSDSDFQARKSMYCMPEGSEGFTAAKKYARTLAAQPTAKFYIDNKDNVFALKEEIAKRAMKALTV